MWRVVAGTVCFAVPVTITALDVFGYVAKVEGASMQVSAKIYLYCIAFKDFLFSWRLLHGLIYFSAFS